MKNVVYIIAIVYMYIAIGISLIFTGIGVGQLINTGLTYYVFPQAQRGGYDQCAHQPPIYYLDNADHYATQATEEQQQIIEDLVREYEVWKQQNTGEECYSAQRQKNIADALTMMIVAIPILLVHIRFVRKERAARVA